MKITLLKPSGRLNPTKAFFLKNGKIVEISYPQAKHWGPRALELAGIREFEQVLKTRLINERAIIILGTAVDDLPSEGVLRNSRNFPDQGTSLISIDVDRFSLPAGMNPLALESVLWFIANHLPAYFHNVTCVVQFSASAGIVDPVTGKPYKPGLNVHLYFQSDRIVPIAAIKAIMRQHPVDTSLYTPVQPHYIANPVIGKGIECLLHDDCRIQLVDGAKEVVSLPDTPWVAQSPHNSDINSEWKNPVGGLPEQRHIMACEFMRWFITVPPEKGARYSLARAFATNAFRTAGDAETFTAEGLDANLPEGYVHCEIIVETLPNSRPLSCRQIVSDGFDCPNYDEHSGCCRLIPLTYSPYALALRIKREGK